MAGKLVFSYRAFSHGKQEGGRSKERQDTAAENWARSQGLTLAAERQYCDDGVSRFNGAARRKGALSRFLKKIGTDAVPRGSILVVEDFSRLSRENPDDAWEMFREILKAGVEIHVLALNRTFTESDLTEYQTRTIVQALQYSAHISSADKARHAKDVWEARRKAAARGEGVQTNLPEWVRRNAQGELELWPERARVLREGVRLALAGQGASLIAEALNASPWSMLWPREGGWTQHAIWRILVGRAIWGAYQPRALDANRRALPVGSIAPHHYPAILTEAEAKAVRTAIRGRRIKRGRPARGRRNILTGLVWDAETGEPLYLRHCGKKDYHDYLTVALDGRYRLVAPYALVESLVKRAVQQWTPAALMPGDRGAATGRAAELLAELDAFAADREAIAQQLRKPGRAAATVALLADQLDAMDARESALKEELADAQSAAGGVPAAALSHAQSLTAQLDALPAGEQADARRRLNDALAEVIDGIWIYRERWGRSRYALYVQVWPRAGACHPATIFKGDPPDGWKPLDAHAKDLRQGYPAPFAPPAAGAARPRRGKPAGK